MLRVISLGAGVQSTTMALMATLGELNPLPDCAIFADTGAEPGEVYKHLSWLETKLVFPVYRVSAGNLREQIVSAMKGEARMDARPPFFITGGGMLNRQCTHDFKLRPIQRKVRELIGLKPRQRAPKVPVVEQWIGISRDEAIRRKPSMVPFVEHRWPLIERDMTRRDCLAWMRSHGYPEPPKSACTFCPYHGNDQWRRLRDEQPEAFAEALAIDEIIRPGMPGPKRPKGEQWFVHADRVPLSEVDLSTPAERGQLDLFLNECEGMCGV